MDPLDDGVLGFLWDITERDCFNKLIYEDAVYILGRTTSDALLRLMKFGAIDGVALHPYTNFHLIDVFCEDGKLYRGSR